MNSEVTHSIPKRIYYVWFGNKPIPLKLKKNINEWKKLNKDYKIVEVNESNFDVKRYPFIKTAIAYKKWAFASDMARLIVLYENGGTYLDTDVKLIKPLSQVPKGSSVWALENSNAINSGLIIQARKYDADLKALINIYQNMNYSPSNEGNYITVKIITNYFHQKRGLKYINKTQRLENGILVLQSDYFAPFHWWGGGRITKKTIGIHQYDGSWKLDKKISFKGKVSNNLILYFPFIGIPLIKLYYHFKD